MFTKGDIAVQTRTLRQEDFDRFAALSGDDNPIHVDPAFAAETRFGQTVAHGMLLYGFIRSTLSSHFPAATQLEQDLMFPAPAYVGDDVTIRAEVAEAEPETRRATLDVTISRAEGEVVCQGSTVLEWAEQ